MIGELDMSISICSISELAHYIDEFIASDIYRFFERIVILSRTTTF